MKTAKLGLAALLLLGASSVHAQSESAPITWYSWQSGGFYGGLGFRHDSLGMPDLTGTNQVPSGGNLFEPVVTTVISRQALYGPEGRFGYVFAPGVLPPWLGRSPRLQLEGFWTTGSTTSDGTSRSVPNFVISLITGQLLVSNGAPGTISTSLQTEAQQYRFAVKVASDFDLAPAWWLTPSIAAFGGRTRLEHNYAELCPCGPVTAVNNFIDARVRWTDIGGRIGAKLSYQMLPTVTLHAAGNVALAHRDASLSAFQSAEAPGAGFNATGSISDSATRLAVVAGGDLGVTFASGSWLLVSIVGGVEYDNRVPGYRGPSFGSVFAVVGSPARLSFTSQFNYHVQARATVRLW